MKENYIGSRLKGFRENMGYSIEQLAQFIGQLPTMIESWERGEEEPGICQWIALSRLYDVSVEEMLGNLSEEELVEEAALEEYQHEVWMNRLGKRYSY